MIYSSQGGYTFNDVWNMPIRYRNHLWNLLNKTIAKQNDEVDGVSSNIKHVKSSKH